MKIHRIFLVSLSTLIVGVMIYILLDTTTPTWIQVICIISLAINSISAILNLLRIIGNYEDSEDSYFIIGKPEDDKKKDAFDQLKNIDFKYIEQFVRMKKLKSLR